MEWKKVEDGLPPVNVLVRVHLVNGVNAVDFVNEPLDKEAPFQHYVVAEWRFLTREELNKIVLHLINSKFLL